MIITNLPEVRSEFLYYIKNHDPYNTKIKESFDNISKSNYYYNKYEDELVTLYQKNFEHILKKIIKSPFKMNCIWYQIYLGGSGSFHEYHTHNDEDCHLSGIYYVKLKDKKISTKFNVNNVEIQPNVCEGDLIIFDSSIPHQSPPNNTEDDKIIVSFNLDLRSKICNI